MPQVCDFSGKVDLNEVQKHFVGIVRYVSDFDAKNITRAEYERAKSLGLTVTLVCEQGNQPALRGRSGGIHDSNIANQQADSLGYPGDATIYYVADDPTPLPSSQWSAVVEYFQALGGRPKGAYGSGPLCAHLLGLGLVAKTWTVSTWGRPAGNSLVQVVGADTFGLVVDVDEIVQSDYGQALQSGGAPQPQPSRTGGSEVPVSVAGNIPGRFQEDVFQVVGGHLWHKWRALVADAPWNNEDVAEKAGLHPSPTFPNQTPQVNWNHSGQCVVTVEDDGARVYYFAQGPAGSDGWGANLLP
jgi:hypothetical protein